MKETPKTPAAFSDPVFSGGGMRRGFVHGPEIAKYTGCPCKAPASMCSGRVLVGQLPSQAARSSVEAKLFHTGAAIRKSDRFRPAAENNGCQSAGLAGFPCSSFSDGIAWK